MRCEASGVLVAKDKAIKRFIVRNIVDASAIRDIQDSSQIEGARALPAQQDARQGGAGKMLPVMGMMHLTALRGRL